MLWWTFFSKLGLNLHKCIGINTDGAAVMMLESCGTESEIQKQYCKLSDVLVSIML